MRFSTVIFAVGASAALVERQSDNPTVAGIEAALSAISDATSSLDSLVNEYTSEDQAADLLAASETIVAAIQQGTTDVGTLTQLGDDELAAALELQPPVEALGDLVGQTIDDVITKKSTFVSTCEGPTVLEQLQDQLAATITFVAAVKTKTPPSAGEIVDDLSAPIVANLQRGVDAFADQTSLPESCNTEPSPSETPSPSDGPSPSETPSPSDAPTSTAAPTSEPAPTSTPHGADPGHPETSTCVPSTTTVTVTVPWTPPTHVPTGGVPSGTPVHPTYTHGTPTPTPPPTFTGAAVANGVTFGGLAAAGLAMLAVF